MSDNAEQEMEKTCFSGNFYNGEDFPCPHKKILLLGNGIIMG